MTDQGVVLPQPRHLTWTTGKHKKTHGRGPTQLVWSGAQDPRIAGWLEQLLGDCALGRVEINLGEVSLVYPQLDADESYQLTVDTDSVTLHAPSTWGALHGVTSLWMLHKNSDLTAASVAIEDTPRFSWRGLLIDVARHFMPLDLLLRVVDGMACLKMNVLHLHLTDDQAFRLHSQVIAGLASPSAYTAEELSRLVDYAAARGVRVIPELDMPGHVTSWLERHPEWGLQAVTPTHKFGVHKACLNPTDEAVYVAIDQLLGELRSIFQDAYIHIGGDEVHPAWWSQDEKIMQFMARENLPDVPALQAYFNRRVCQLVAKHGRKVVGWDEVLHPDMPSMLVQNWRGATTRDRALAKGLDCLVSAGYYLDLFYPADIYYGYEPEAHQAALLAYEDGLREDIRLRHVAAGIAWTDQWRAQAITLEPDRAVTACVIGGEACLWSELVDEHTLQSRLWSRLPAVAERLWSPQDVDDVEDFYRRMVLCVALPGFELHKLQHVALTNIGLSDTQIAIAMLLEPVKWYARLLGEQALQARLRGTEMPQARPYDVHTPLNRIVDHIAPESLSARTLNGLTDEQMRQRAMLWTQLDPRVWPQDVREAIGAFKAVGVELLTILTAGKENVRKVADAQAALQDLYVPHGEYMLAVIPPLLDWLQRWHAGDC